MQEPDLIESVIRSTLTNSLSAEHHEFFSRDELFQFELYSPLWRNLHVKRYTRAQFFCAFGYNKTKFDLWLRQGSPDWVKKELSIVGLRIKHELMGNSMLDLEKIQHKKAIATTRSFEKIYTKYEDLSERVSAFTAYSSEKLRKQNSHSNLVMVFIRTNYFRKDQPQYSRSIVIKTDYATSSYIELNRCAQIGLKKIYKPGYHYKKAGVILMGISPDSSTQLSLFESPIIIALLGSTFSLLHAYNKGAGEGFLAISSPHTITSK